MSNFIILFLGGILGLLLAFAYLIPQIKRIIRVHQTPPYSTDTIPDGKLVGVTGKVQSDGSSIYSPLTRTACVLWYAEVRVSRGGVESSSWETLFDGRSIHPFEIKNGKEILKIYPTNAELMLHVDWYREANATTVPFEPELHVTVAKLINSSMRPGDLTRPIQVLEKVVKANETVYILGAIKENNGVRVISSNDGSLFWISDRSQTMLLATLYGRVIFVIAFFTGLGVLIAQLILSKQ